MKAEAINLDGKKAGTVELSDEIFALEPRVDILHRVVRWQRNNAQSGTHKVKTRSETAYSTKKIYRQKGTGGARHGSRNAPIFRGGGVYKGPTPRSHGHELPKKVRKLGLMHALSAKVAAGEFIVVDLGKLKELKTSELAKKINELGWKRALVIDGASVNPNLAKAAKNISGMDILPSVGANVYDILRRDTLARVSRLRISYTLAPTDGKISMPDMFFAALAKLGLTEAPSITKALFHPSSLIFFANSLVFNSLSLPKSTTMNSPAATFAESACINPNFRTFFGSSCP